MVFFDRLIPSGLFHFSLSADPFPIEGVSDLFIFTLMYCIKIMYSLQIAYTLIRRRI